MPRPLLKDDEQRASLGAIPAPCPRTLRPPSRQEEGCSGRRLAGPCPAPSVPERAGQATGEAAYAKQLLCLTAAGTSSEAETRPGLRGEPGTPSAGLFWGRQRSCRTWAPRPPALKP